MPRASPGHYAFNDLHVLLALLGADELCAPKLGCARCAARALRRGCRRSNHAMAREVGVPLMRGLLAFAHGDYDAVAEHALRRARAGQRFGGSHAQRDLIDQTLLAAPRARQPARARPRAAQRAPRGKPPTPLTRHWARRLGVRDRSMRS